MIRRTRFLSSRYVVPATGLLRPSNNSWKWVAVQLIASFNEKWNNINWEKRIQEVFFLSINTLKVVGRFRRLMETRLKNVSRFWSSFSVSVGAPRTPWRNSSRASLESKQLKTSCKINIRISLSSQTMLLARSQSNKPVWKKALSTW